MDEALHQPLDEAGYHKLMAAVETLSYLTELVSDKATTLNRLRQLLGIELGSTEKTAAVLAAVAAAMDSANGNVSPEGGPDGEHPGKDRHPGHGRRQPANMRAPSVSP